MKRLMLLCLIVCIVGCATLQSVPNVPGDLSQHFGDGGVLKPGDRVVITTTTGAKHQFRVTSVHDGVIYGYQDSVPFSEIASVERRELSEPKTALAAAIHAGSHPNAGI